MSLFSGKRIVKLYRIFVLLILLVNNPRISIGLHTLLILCAQHHFDEHRWNLSGTDVQRDDTSAHHRHSSNSPRLGLHDGFQRHTGERIHRAKLPALAQVAQHISVQHECKCQGSVSR